MEGVPLAQTTERDGVKDWKANGMDTSAAEKQEGGMEWEYTKDGSVDLFGRPADRKRLGGTRTLPFSLGIQFLTTVAYYGVATNLVLYLTQKLYQDTSKATTNVTNWDGATLLFSAIGAFFADSYLGRYWASVLFVLFYFIGLLLATLTTILPSLKPVPCTPTLSSPCLPLTGKRIWVFYLALYIQSLGFGGYQPCNIAFGADQFDEQHEREKKQKSMYFSLTYAASNAAGLIGNTFLIYLESKDSYTWGYAISTGLVGLGLLGYLSAVFISRYQKPQGNPLTRITQVLVAAARNWHLQPPSDPDDLYELYSKSGRRLVHTNQFE